MTDGQRYGGLGCHGNPVVRTPNLDRLYQEAIRLTDFHDRPFCTPTRTALMTGCYPERTVASRTSFGRTTMHTTEKSIADVFAAWRDMPSRMEPATIVPSAVPIVRAGGALRRHALRPRIREQEPPQRQCISQRRGLKPRMVAAAKELLQAAYRASSTSGSEMLSCTCSPFTMLEITALRFLFRSAQR